MAKFKIGGQGIDREDLEGGAILPGWFLGTLYSEEENEKGQEILHFKITGPTQAGASRAITLNNPIFASDEVQGKKQVERALLVAYWLNIHSKEDVRAGRDIDWAKGVGWKGVMHLEEQEYNNRETGQTGKKVDFPFRGVYSLDSESIPPAVRVHLGLPLLPGQVIPAAGSLPTTGGKKDKGKAAASTPVAGAPTAPPDLSDLDA
jgi:hypothetical protein